MTTRITLLTKMVESVIAGDTQTAQVELANYIKVTTRDILLGEASETSNAFVVYEDDDSEGEDKKFTGSIEDCKAWVKQRHTTLVDRHIKSVRNDTAASGDNSKYSISNKLHNMKVDGNVAFTNELEIVWILKPTSNGMPLDEDNA